MVLRPGGKNVVTWNWYDKMHAPKPSRWRIPWRGRVAVVATLPILRWPDGMALGMVTITEIDGVKQARPPQLIMLLR